MKIFKIMCDGCGAEITAPAARGLHPAPIPAELDPDTLLMQNEDQHFDWCRDCTEIAFAAVAEHKRVAIDGGQVHP
jgi:hypothetical protein